MANPFFVQPVQFGQGLQSLAGSVQQFGQQRQEQQQAQQQAEYKQAAKQAMAQAFQSGDPAAIRQAVIEYPEIAETATQMFGFTNEQTERAARETYRKALSDPDNAAQYLQQGIEQVSQFGGQPNMMSRDLQMFQENPEAALKNMRAGYAAIASDQEYDSMFAPEEGGGGGFGNVNPRDFTPESLARFQQSGDYSDLVRYESQRNVEIGGVPHVFDPRIGGYRPATVGGGYAGGYGGGGQQPAAGGQQGGGQPRPSGAITAEDVGRSQGTIAASERAAEEAIKRSGEAFDQLSSVRQATANLDEAIQLIDEGAGTGPVMSKLPSVREASIKLDNLQGRLGLDVIGNTTFGALSESELNFALSTALPKNLEGPALKEWLQKKKQSQEKLANYLEDAAMFLGRPGNTVADFLERQKGRGRSGEGSDIDSLINKYAPEQ